MRPVGCAGGALADCGVSYTYMDSGDVFPTPDLPLGSRCCHGAPLLTNPSRHPAGYKAPGWISTCGRWGCAGAALAGCGVELHRMESGDVFYTPDLALGSLRDVMVLRY